MHEDDQPASTRHVDLLIDAWYVVTMNGTRDIIHRGSVAVDQGVIVDVGKTADLDRRYVAGRRLGGDRFVLRREWSTPTSTSPASR